jgi:hypothetical protein
MAGVDLSPYVQRKNSVYGDFAAKVAANQFSRTLAARDGARRLQDYTKGYQAGLPNLTTSYTRRGMAGPSVRSGVYQNAMSRYASDYTTGLGRMNEDNFHNLQGFDMNSARFAAERDAALSDLELQKAALIANTASQIQSLRPYMGG